MEVACVHQKPKIMRYLLLLFAFILMNTISFAQFENFDLSKYKLPEIKRHQLDFEFDVSSGFSNEILKENRSSSILDFNEDLKANYSYYFNSIKRQSNYYLQFSSDIQFNKEITDNNLFQKRNYNYTNLLLFTDDRFYLNDDAFFIHIKPEFSISRRKIKENLPANTKKVELRKEELENEYNIDFEINFGFGFGRIESTGDLRQSIYILEELFKNNCLKRLPSEKEILTIADKIAKLKNQRFFDSRLQKIYEIKSIDSLLQRIDLIEQTDAVYFTSINDYWNYGRESRNSGTRIQFDFVGKYHYSYDKDLYRDLGLDLVDLQEWEYITKQNIKFYGISVELDSYKPINLKWQRYFGISSSFIHSTDAEVNGEPSGFDIDSNVLKLNSRYGYNWFLNTRTSAYGGTQLGYSQFVYTQKDVEKNYRVNLSMNGRINYYFSPRLRMSYNLSAQFSLFEELYFDIERKLVFSNSISLNYALF